MKKRIVAAAALAALASAVTALAASAAGDYGPDTCLVGWVWRGATSSDHVCVSSAERDQVTADNAQAAARREPDGGAFGRDTCLQGYVWREAVADDHVCVVPATRDLARAQNAQAASRRDDVRVALRTYYPPQLSCDGPD